MASKKRYQRKLPSGCSIMRFSPTYSLAGRFQCSSPSAFAPDASNPAVPTVDDEASHGGAVWALSSPASATLPRWGVDESHCLDAWGSRRPNGLCTTSAAQSPKLETASRLFLARALHRALYEIAVRVACFDRATTG